MALTPKQQRFVAEYLIDLNGKQAAIRSGYSVRRAEVTASELLTNRKVSEAIAQSMAKREQRTQITQDQVLTELAKIGFADIRKVMSWGNTTIRAEPGKDGEVEMVPFLALIDSSEIDDSTAAAISEVSQGKEGLKVKMHDKKGALVDIGRHLGMFTDKVSVSGPNGGPLEVLNMTPAELEAATTSGMAKLFNRGSH